MQEAAMGTTSRVQLSGTIDPTFITKCGSDYYVTQSLASYILADAVTESERADVDSVAKMFDSAKQAGAVCEAVRVPKENNVMSFQQTSRR
jgi:hypothetical protein